MGKSAIDEIKEYLQQEIKRQESNMGYDDHSGTVLNILEKVIEIESKHSKGN